MQEVFFRQSEVNSLSIAAFFQKLDDTLFTPQFDTYEHLTFLNDPNGFKWIVLGLYFGLLIASIFMFYNKNVLGSLIRKLDRAGACDPESAKTLSELACTKNIFYRIALKRGNSIRKVVAVAPSEGEKLPDEATLFVASALGRKCDTLTDRFYIPKSKRDRTIDRFDSKGSGWLSVVLMAVLGLALVIIIFKAAPLIAGMIENALASSSAQK